LRTIKTLDMGTFIVIGMFMLFFILFFRGMENIGRYNHAEDKAIEKELEELNKLKIKE
jgi:hypothetical protein